MMHRTLRILLTSQRDCVAVWQLRTTAEWTAKQVRHRLQASGLRPVPGIDGVWTSTRGQLAKHQRWQAATLSAPDTALAGISAALLHGFGDLPRRELFIVVVRAGRGGPRRHGGILVCRNSTSCIERRDGIAVTTPAQTIIDLAPNLDDIALRRAVIEALRLRRASLLQLSAALPRRRGAPRLRAVLDSVADLPIARCKSNAEATALVRLKSSGRPIPDVNVDVAGYEVDQFDPATGTVTEIDGAAFHADTAKDAARDADLRRRGLRVVRRPSGDAYDPDAAW